MGRAARAVKPAPELRLDLGCGPHKRDGFQGVDRVKFDGVDHVVDLTKTPWKWAANSVTEAHASHFVEHLTVWQRVAFCNELYRIMKPAATCQIIVPHWASCRAYGDPTHQWPPISEFWFLYLDRQWRLANAPHTDVSVIPEGFSCDFHTTQGYNVRQDIMVRGQDFQQFAMANYKEVCQDILATIRAVK